jgi:Tol biopolymer transport system component
MNADGSAQRRLTRNETQDFSPAWSPDGTKIAFTRRCWHTNDKYDADTEVFVMNADGSGQRNLTRRARWSDESPAWSPDGTKIAFVSSRGRRRALEGGGQAPIWRIVVMNTDGSGQHVLIRNSSRGGHPVTWSPDGKTLAFVRGLPATGTLAIYVMKSDGTGQKRLTDPHVNSFDPAWSPDGTKIAFTSDRGMDNGIYIMSPDGSRQRLTHDGGESAAWSADGSKLAFKGTLDGQVYVVNADGSGLTRLTRPPAEQPFVQNTDLAWQPASHRRSPGK